MEDDVVRAAQALCEASGSRFGKLRRRCNSQGAIDLGFRKRSGLQSGLKAAYVAGDNPARDRPDVAEKLSKLDFLLVQDLFLTETARMADVVLPAASFAEVEGTFTGASGKKLLVKGVTPSRGLPDWKIASLLAKKMGASDFEFEGPEDDSLTMVGDVERLEDVLKDIARALDDNVLIDTKALEEVGFALDKKGGVDKGLIFHPQERIDCRLLIRRIWQRE